jgi:hypothetical protein
VCEGASCGCVCSSSAFSMSKTSSGGTNAIVPLRLQKVRLLAACMRMVARFMSCKSGRHTQTDARTHD